MKTVHPHPDATRPSKAALLPEVIQLAKQGQTCREIAGRVGVSKSTVSNWLQGRQAAAVAKSLGRAKGLAWLATRYVWMYHKSLRELNRSRAKKKARAIEKTGADDGKGEKTKKTARSESRVANPAFMTKAYDALKGLVNLHYREAALRGEVEPPVDVPPAFDSITPEDMATMTDDELYDLDLRLAARDAAAGIADDLPVLTKEQLRALTPEQRRAIEAQCLADIRQAEEAEAAEQKDEGGRMKDEGGKAKDEDVQRNDETAPASNLAADLGRPLAGGGAVETVETEEAPAMAAATSSPAQPAAAPCAPRPAGPAAAPAGRAACAPVPGVAAIAATGAAKTPAPSVGKPAAAPSLRSTEFIPSALAQPVASQAAPPQFISMMDIMTATTNAIYGPKTSS